MITLNGDVQCSVYLDHDDWRTLRVKAFEQGTTASALVRQAVREFLAASGDEKELPLPPPKQRRANDPVAILDARHGGVRVCAHCGDTRNISVDHVWPVSKGGTNSPDNLQWLCRSCNSRKGARVYDSPEVSA